MTITKISYGRTYPLGNYASERIDFEASIESDQDPHQALQSLKNQVQHFHESTNPHLYQEPAQPQYGTTNQQSFAANAPLEIKREEEKISQEQEIANTISEIENATTETLHTFKLQAAKNVKTAGAFKKRQKQLGIS